MAESSTIPEMRRRRYSRLPAELQLMILRHVYDPNDLHLVYLRDNYTDPEPLKSIRERLKPVRLISRSFHDAVTPIVFASIHLHASESSLQRAENIANSPLAHHVQEIVHHEGTFGGTKNDEKHFFSMLNSHRRRRDYPKDYPFLSDQDLYSNYLEEVAAGRRFQAFEIDRMTALLQKLPRCISFTALPYLTQWCDPITSAYTLRRTGLAYLPLAVKTGALNTPTFVSSMTQWRPRALNLTNFSYDSLHRLLQLLWRNVFLGNDPAAIENWAEQLTYLRYGYPENTAFPGGISMDQFEYPRLLARLLRNSHNLVHLEITCGFDQRPQQPLFPEDALPKLTHLTISKGGTDGFWSEELLLRYIKELGRTLKHLHFDNITILPSAYAARQASRQNGSLLRLLYNITPCTNLETCTGLDTVTDTKDSNYNKLMFVISGHKPGKSVILSKVQDAVCGKQPWPENFTMDHLPMEIVAFEVPTGIMTDEAAFIFSNWADTVDPWEKGITHVDVPDGDELEQFMDMCNLSEGKASELTGPIPTGRQQSPKSPRSRRNRISKILGFK